MTLERRSLLKRAAIAAAASALPGRAFGEFADGSGDFETDYRDLETSLLQDFDSFGYAQAAPAPLVTDDFAFNGGLRYDALGVPTGAGQVVVQSCARVDDIVEKVRPDVLSVFNIFHWAPPAGTTGDDIIVLLHQAMSGSVGLDPARMGYVSIPAFETRRATLEDLGLNWSQQVVLRDPIEARAARDGSGYWQRPYPRNEPVIPSAGLYYWIGDGMPDLPLTYPTSQHWIEIADVGIDDAVDLAASCGLDRLVLAATGRYPTWNERLDLLMERIAASGSEPPGKQLFEMS
jgi:hypothetical protein